MKKIAIVTGASSGLGSDFVRLLAESGDASRELDEIWAVARRRDRLEALAAETRPTPVRPLVADLGGDSGPAAIRVRLEEERPELRLLILNAGYGKYGPFSDSAKDEMLGMVDLNIRSLTETAKDALPFMPAGSGMVLVASLAGLGPMGELAVYSATKAYVLSLGVALSVELEGRGIKVTTLCPGPVATEFSAVASGGRVGPRRGSVGPREVAQRCLKDLSRGKTLSFGHWSWRLASLGPRLLTRRGFARLTAKFAKR